MVSLLFQSNLQVIKNSSIADGKSGILGSTRLVVSGNLGSTFILCKVERAIGAVVEAKI